MNTASPRSLAELRAAWRYWLSGSSATKPPFWVQASWTFAFSAVVAIGFTVLGFVATARTLAQWMDLNQWAVWYGSNLTVSLTIGVAIQGMFRIAFALMGRARVAALQGWRRTVFFSSVPMLGVALGWPIGMTLVFGDLRQFAGMPAGKVVSLVVLSVMISLAFQLYFALRTREIRAEMRANEAQLRLLQGQMEPHFLFNTLANVISLIDADAPRAKRMLEELTDYLRASLGGLRHADSTLAAELELARRYLQLMQSRMGERLRFEIDADAALRHAALMPLVLQPLIENAVKHGLEPQVEGGTVRVSATRRVVAGQDSLQVCVEDDGAGLAAAARRPPRRVAAGGDGNGIALANLRERLHARFGNGAQLALEDAGDDHGTRACLVIPWQVADATAA
jgi:signal transduction histidine kinase